ncbi:hypothetical protein [Limobrevibacterium gyesilva]|uniref:Uncharacterized protein n=1 Tax=Limobrevibacterium gyesilva TaxID=2991712 RepID=A0AA42CFZ9_9PROT|nr:hypothetical protein [Limobrevibacterium gyesilva]MCW3477199.1 hypothetical protein [Limobrevibacterium gyesilva]
MDVGNLDAVKYPCWSGACPSGQTTRVTVTAIILASMLPEKKGIIWARADEYA